MSILGFLKSQTGQFLQVSDTAPLPTSMPLVTTANPLPVATPAANLDNVEALSLTNAAANASGADLANTAYGAANIVVDVTAISGTTPSLTITVEGKDPVSGKYFTVLQSAALTAVGTTVLSVGIGLPATANVSANAILPRTWRVSAAIGGATPAVTAKVGVIYAS